MAALSLQYTLQAAKHQVGAAATITYLHATYSTDVRTINNPSLSALKRGTGGRSSFNGIVATVFGATGFVGRYVCNRLGKIGTQLILPYRGDHYDNLRLKLVGDLGQVLFVPYDLRDEESIYKAIQYSNVVINLVGRDWETRNFSFHDVHVQGARTLARLSKEAGVEKFVHVSALNASSNPKPIILKNGSKFLQSKYYGELAVKEEFPEAIVFRPGVIFGQEDRFLRSYTKSLRNQMRGIPLWRKGQDTVKQPVFVSDVAIAIVNAIKDPDAVGKTYQAVGPKRYFLGDLVDWFFAVMRRDRKWGYFRYDMRFDPIFLAKTLFMQNISPGWPFGLLHFEGLEQQHTTDTVLPGVPTLEDLGVTLTKMEDQVPWELKPWRAAAYYDEELGEFDKPPPPKEAFV
ncbi:NADH dehydrogenase [ubiquinone] 1 alpha subcomplex subunit 9, mitochondrial [Zootermopsis nevadensis]|uniref:NADH dehydrogenase [ubiquinone] 1 alpha subcomplex subunit 9, mitochondrial n=1 Tax=Zootermopsis nevadensis TaxID=136037 RepID=A0A067RSM5_ZOONE|nr:NADH dehydrogenase [ubiquinone] 1 alpha subcomplex subunit 9, mitochondrial [Zootermopsis nevadensis]KDR23820.1 NADH dehydrogenase [ubiquinone] 1 alpha subcomplex subunit 9, mitochondrial [Zootermopsis nevadensis]